MENTYIAEEKERKKEGKAGRILKVPPVGLSSESQIIHLPHLP